MADKWMLFLERDRSPNTIRQYRGTLNALEHFLDIKGMPSEVEYIKLEHLQAFMTELHERGAAPATMANRQAIIKTFFAFLLDEDDIPRSPAERLRAVRQPEQRTPILDAADIEAMRRACRGPAFADKRALAIFELMLDTGLRRQELADLQVNDLDLSGRVVNVRHGKGDKARLTRYTTETALTLARYKTARKQELRRLRRSDSEWLWVGHRGRFTDAGIEEALKGRAEKAGVPGFHLHRLRHTWATNNRRHGMSDASLMALGGWSSATVMGRYGKAAAMMTALEEYDRVRK
jgi:site-specific recombinase XerD